MSDHRNQETESEPATIEIFSPWRQLDRWFELARRDAFAPFGLPSLILQTEDAGFISLPSDVLDRGDHYEVRADVPGVPKDAIDVRVQGNALRIRAQQQAEKEEKATNFLRRERSYRAFERDFELPEAVPAGSVLARLENGVLTISIPKAKPIPEEKVPVA
ncbi:MAG: Hsp20/alpha crystallin family protein [Thermoplasmata archaeon]|nr:Hsp20/alpha crystallin family protein [Thermoplasmata archaeon]